MGVGPYVYLVSLLKINGPYKVPEKSVVSVSFPREESREVFDKAPFIPLCPHPRLFLERSQDPVGPS